MRDSLNLKCNIRRIIPVAMLLWMVYLSIAFSEEIQNIKGPIEIKAEELTLYREKNRAVFIKDVHVLVKDKELKIDCDRLEVYYGKKGGVVKLIARKNVVIRHKERVLKADTAVYHRKDELIVLKGSPVYRDKKGELKGEIIKYYVRTGVLKISDVSGKVESRGGE